MNIKVRPYEKSDIASAVGIWNEIVGEGMAFPQIDELSEEEGHEFLISQTFTGIAFDEKTGEVVGLYILHPNNIGRCGHIGNASFGIKSRLRGNRIGEALIQHCLDKAEESGFHLLQFNAVVASNLAAIKLYEKTGFIKLGTIPGGFCTKAGKYEDIILYYYVLKEK